MYVMASFRLLRLAMICIRAGRWQGGQEGGGARGRFNKE